MTGKQVTYAAPAPEALENFLMKRVAALALSLVVPFASPAEPGSLDVEWLEGAEDCASSDAPPLQVHAFDPQTYILRQSPCADFEATSSIS